MISEQEQKVYEILNKLQIEYVRYEHKAVYTIKEADELDVSIPGELCKNLFLRNRKGNIHYLIILQESKQADLKLLACSVGTQSLSFASPERLYRYLQLQPGSVTPFGLINDSEKAVQVLIDKDLIGVDSVSFHPNVNTATINISYKDFEKFLKWCGNSFEYIQIN